MRALHRLNLQMLVSLPTVLNDIHLASWVTNHEVLLGRKAVRNCDH